MPPNTRIALNDTTDEVTSLKRTWKDRKNKKDKKPKLYFHVLQIDEGDGFGFYDLDIDRDWGLLYKLKKEWIEEAPEFKYRIVTRSTSRTWSEVFNNEI
jgi:hypothetical protein